ncbi:MAG: mechanosensitive ion channel family protein [Candidatus Electrothrix sp. GM3_4]|nr:mechanosensitive ion channel family protein [Candidatus Electrothrix sp. GM3_4]
MDFSILPQAFTLWFSTTLTDLSQYQLGQRFTVICFYIILSKAADMIVSKILLPISIRTSFDVDEHFVRFIRRPAVLSVFLLGILHAALLEPAFPSPWNTVLPNLIKTLILAVWWISLIREITVMNENNSGWVVRKFDKTRFYMLKNISRIILLFIGIIWALIIWKVNLTPLFASAGIVGIAIALAAKDTLANFFGGIALFTDAAYKVGDYIILETGERGEVVELGIRSTKIKTRDYVMITIPNSIMSTTKIINQSAPEVSFRIRIDVNVSYHSNLRTVEKALLHIAEENQALERKTEPRVRVRSFGESAIHLQLLVWVEEPAQRGLQTHNLLKMIHIAFKENGIEIPFPQRTLHLNTSGTDPNLEPAPVVATLTSSPDEG